jgi:hypothetical protein
MNNAKANVTLIVASICWILGSIRPHSSPSRPAAGVIGVAPPPSTIAVILPSVELDKLRRMLII